MRFRCFAAIGAESWRWARDSLLLDGHRRLLRFAYRETRGETLRSRVIIHDHLTHQDHVSTWCVQGYGFAAIEGAIHAAFVRAFGTSAGRIEIVSLDETCQTGELYAIGMRVSVLSISDQVGFNTRAEGATRFAEWAETTRKAVAA